MTTRAQQADAKFAGVEAVAHKQRGQDRGDDKEHRKCVKARAKPAAGRVKWRMWVSQGGGKHGAGNSRHTW